MENKYLDNIIRRSRLIMPANNKKFIEKAYARNADAIVLDLEDSVADSEKVATRELIKESISIAGKGGSDVLVRVNHTNELLNGDVEAAVWPGLSGIYFPKVESKHQVIEMDQLITKLEEKRGIPVGTITIGILIESIKGYMNVHEIAKASERIDSLTLGAEDFALDTGMEVSPDTFEALLIPRMQILFAARENGILPLGLMGSLTTYNDLNGFLESAQLAYKHGFLGASCIHPQNVEVLNKGFSPSVEDVDHAKRVIDVFEFAASEGKAATKLDGKMIDTPHYEIAKRLLKRSVAIEKFELKKKQAREMVINGG